MGPTRSRVFRTPFPFAALLLGLAACSSPRSVWVSSSADAYVVAETVREVFQEQGFRILNWDRDTTELALGTKEITTTNHTVRWTPRVRMTSGAGGWVVHLYVWRQEGEMDRGVEVDTEEGDRDDDLELRLRNRLIGALQARGIDATVGPE